MGMFDNLRCKYPLPIPGTQDLVWQTKDTSAQSLDNYEIREDGTLWHEDYDIEDRSDKTKTGIEALFGCMTAVNQRWEQCADFTGEICFYAYNQSGSWIEYSSYFVSGVLKSLNVIETKETTP